MLPVDGGDDVIHLDALSRTVRFGVHLGHHQPRLEAGFLGRLLVQSVAGDPQHGTADAAIGGQLLDDLLHRTAGHSEPQPLHGGGGGHHLHVIDADDLTVEVHQRPAGVAGVQGGGGLDEGHGVAVQGHVPVDAGDDAVGERPVEGDPQGVADGQGFVPHLQFLILAKLRRGQPRGVDLEQRQVGLRIAAHQLSGVALPVVGGHLCRRLVVNDVGTGDDIPVFREHHPGARPSPVPILHRDADGGRQALLVQLLIAQRLLADGVVQRQGHAGAVAIVGGQALGLLLVLAVIVPGVVSTRSVGAVAEPGVLLLFRRAVAIVVPQQDGAADHGGDHQNDERQQQRPQLRRLPTAFFPLLRGFSGGLRRLGRFRRHLLPTHGLHRHPLFFRQRRHFLRRQPHIRLRHRLQPRLLLRRHRWE